MNISARDKLAQEISPPVDSRIMDFQDFEEMVTKDPFLLLRSISQIFYDMVKKNLIPLEDKYKDDPQRIGYTPYDCTPLFVENIDRPFFADMIFANNLAMVVETLKKNAQQAKIQIFRGPPGSGKSTFLNAILKKFEDYSATPEGFVPEVVWKINIPRINAELDQEKELEIPCPNHDHPILLIPKRYRKKYLSELLADHDKQTKEQIFQNNEFNWIFKKEPCTICASIWDALRSQISDIHEIFSMIKVRPRKFDRRTGNGISVFGSGDKISKEDDVITDKPLQKKIDRVFGSSNKIHYVFSSYAKTNNGIYALMDIKENNVPRLWDLHNLVSEGVHKVKDVEEKVDSLFLVVMNPEDDENIKDGGKSLNSLSDRVQYHQIPYVKDYLTEVEIYRKTLGEEIESWFLPGVLKNFARAIISSRLPEDSPALKKWIQDPDFYEHCCDRKLKLLKMEFYSNNIPSWLDKEDRDNLTTSIRKELIEESNISREKAISGRDAIQIVSILLSMYQKKNRLITMNDVIEFLQHLRENVKHKINGELENVISTEFLNGLNRFYNYQLIQQIKEAMYEYNHERIAKEIKNYLSALNCEETNGTITCRFTGEKLNVTEDFLRSIEDYLFYDNSFFAAQQFLREEIQKKFVSITLSQEILIDGKDIEKTKQFQELMDQYSRSLKQNVLIPFIKNENFRRAIKEYDQENFKNYDSKIKRKVNLLFDNLMTKFNYSREGAQQACIQALDVYAMEKEY